MPGGMPAAVEFATHPKTPEDYDLVILGSGTGTKLAAWTLAAQGQRVTVIVRKCIGGSCPNIACMPSKNIIHSAKAASYIRRSEEFGISHGSATLRIPIALARCLRALVGGSRATAHRRERKSINESS